MNPSLWISGMSLLPLDKADMRSLVSGERRLHLTERTSLRGSVVVNFIPLTGTFC